MSSQARLVPRRGALLLLAGAALLLAALVVVGGGHWPAREAAGAGAAAAAAERPQAPLVQYGERSFYVTEENFDGSQALAACVEGYHMASLWEMMDVTALSYATDLAEARVQSDQGMGPPAGWWGWVRTGNGASAVNAAGQANCMAWTSNTAGDFGSLVRLNASWATPRTAISPWQAQVWGCNLHAPVWCVSDPVYGVFLPGVWK